MNIIWQESQIILRIQKAKNQTINQKGVSYIYIKWTPFAKVNKNKNNLRRGANPNQNSGNDRQVKNKFNQAILFAYKLLIKRWLHHLLRHDAPRTPKSSNHHATKHLKHPNAPFFATIKNQGCNLDKIKGATSVEIKEFQEKSNKSSTKTNPKQSSIK